MAPTRVGLIGATGETGSSILAGLTEEGGFETIALTRPASMSKSANQALKASGVELRALDLQGPQDAIVQALEDVEILISAIGPTEQLQQIPLATAAKAAGVKLFVPCAFITAMPVGIHLLRDQKEEVYNHIKRIGLPYTIIDVGWWYQISFPPLPSGKIDYAVGIPGQRIAGDGNQLSARTDLRDIGKYVARVIRDERTRNQMVLVYNEMWSINQIYDALEKLSGEELTRNYVSREDLENQIADAEAKLVDDPGSFMLGMQKVSSQYLISWGIRGDNTPEYAKYLGYITSKELYPDMGFVKFEDYLKEVLDGKAKGVYEELKVQFAAASKKLGKQES